MDVQTLRDLLMEIGTEQYNEAKDERRTVTISGKIWVLTGRIQEVIGVWGVNDGNRITNLATSGAHDGKAITLDVVQPAGTEVLAAYISKEGLNDVTAQIVIDWGHEEVLGELQDPDLNLFTPTTQIERLARVYWQMIVMYNAYLMLNNVNFVQSDGNISLFSYAQMSKLWGEGMSTDALFMRLDNKIGRVQKTLMLLTTSADVYVGPSYLDVWKDEDMLSDWLSDVHRAHSRYTNYELETIIVSVGV